MGAEEAHTSCVFVVHVLVSHGRPEKNADGLKSLQWKSTPSMVIEAAPETWAFKGWKVEIVVVWKLGYAARNVAPHEMKTAILLQRVSAV